MKRIIKLDRFPIFGFANKIIMYYNMRTMVANNQDIFDGFTCFDDKQLSSMFDQSYMGIEDTSDSVVTVYPYIDTCAITQTMTLSYTKYPLRDFIQFKEPIVPTDGTVAVHFRGGDFHVWRDGRAIYPKEYYINALKAIREETDELLAITLYTDDTNFGVYREIKSLLLQGEIIDNVTVHQSPHNMYDDFRCIASSEYVVSSASTYCITASMLGREDKKIIHFDDFFRGEIDHHGDIFFGSIYNNDSPYYKTWKFV